MGRHAEPDTQPSERKIRKYAKGIVSVAGAVSIAATTLTMQEGPLTWDDWINTGIAFLTALGVIGVRNKNKEKG